MLHIYFSAPIKSSKTEQIDTCYLCKNKLKQILAIILDFLRVSIKFICCKNTRQSIYTPSATYSLLYSKSMLSENFIVFSIFDFAIHSTCNSMKIIN